jgi:hypothetical protein
VKVSSQSGAFLPHGYWIHYEEDPQTYKMSSRIEGITRQKLIIKSRNGYEAYLLIIDVTSYYILWTFQLLKGMHPTTGHDQSVLEQTWSREQP